MGNIIFGCQHNIPAPEGVDLFRAPSIRRYLGVSVDGVDSHRGYLTRGRKRARCCRFGDTTRVKRLGVDAARFHTYDAPRDPLANPQIMAV